MTPYLWFQLFFALSIGVAGFSIGWLFGERSLRRRMVRKPEALLAPDHGERPAVPVVAEEGAVESAAPAIVTRVHFQRRRILDE